MTQRPQQSTQFPIPLAILRDLRCRHCDRFVTCAPVHVVPDSSVLCGRCANLAIARYRNRAYEALASIFLYPCAYWFKHCDAMLTFDECLTHEPSCTERHLCVAIWSKPWNVCKTTRKLPNNENVRLQHVPESIIDRLKCVHCESYLNCSPIHIGADGKNICHRCYIANGLPDGFVRNLAYERLADAIIFPCIYRFRGCPVRLRYGRDAWRHESDCSYGQVYERRGGVAVSTRRQSSRRDGKERGVIETHSGHIYATLTPNSALFAPPKTSYNQSGDITHEVVSAMMMMRKTRITNGDDVENTITPLAIEDQTHTDSARSSAPRDMIEELKIRQSMRQQRALDE